MYNFWLAHRLFSSLGRSGFGVFSTAVADLAERPARRRGAAVDAFDGHDIVHAFLPERNTVALLDVRGNPDAARADDDWKDIFVSGDLLDELLDDRDAASIYDRFIDVSNIEAAKTRSGLKHVQDRQVRAIFVPGSRRRLHFSAPTDGPAILLGIFPSELFETHAASRGVRQPSLSDLAMAVMVHKAALAIPIPAAAPVRPLATVAPLHDGWVTLNRLRELGVASEDDQRAVLAASDAEALYDLAGRIPDDAITALETLIELKTGRHADRKLELVELVNTELFRSPTAAGPTSFADAVEILTPQQRQIVERSTTAPIRLRGGPGTGKTFTAVLRAGHLLSEAAREERRIRVGYFVLSRDLGTRIVADFKTLGLDGYFDEPGNAGSQRLVVTNLLDWGERFLDLDALGVEPLAPYRADRVDEERHAALDFAVADARRVLSGDEHAALWRAFDIKNRDNLRELETEISQFVKGRDLTDLNSYLAERRPAGSWLSCEDKGFRKFIWEVTKIYDRALRDLAYIDGDDVVNDCLKEVSKATWQQFRKPKDGFDYLIVDEAQDFFRNQLSLVSQLVKDPTGLMLCYDEAQAIYSRYPNLRELGFDNDATFFGRNLERNFRSTKQIVAAIRAVAASYPAAMLEATWGKYEAADDAATGPKPVASGFLTETAMIAQVRDILQERLASGTAPSECAVIAFDDDLRRRIMQSLQEAGMRCVDSTAGRKAYSAKSVVLADPKRAKGHQFELCVVAGVDRDHFPNLSETKTDLQRTTRREDGLREFLVAMSRARRYLHFVWAGREPSEFVDVIGGHLDRRA